MKNTNYEQMSNSELIKQVEYLYEKYYSATTYSEQDEILNEMGVL